MQSFQQGCWLLPVRNHKIWPGGLTHSCSHTVHSRHYWAQSDTSLYIQIDITQHIWRHSMMTYPVTFRDHFVYAPSQWEAISHWLGTYIEWSLKHSMGVKTRCFLNQCNSLALFGLLGYAIALKYRHVFEIFGMAWLFSGPFTPPC